VKNEPEIKYYPYCGGEVRFHLSVPRCQKCRAVFFVQFSRYMRESRKAANQS